MNILLARWLLFKGNRLKLILGMLLPLIITVVVTSIYHNTEDDFRVPVAVVIKDDLDVSNIIDGLEDTDYISLTVFEDIDKPLRNLEQYQFDSLFVFEADFYEKLQNNERRNLITSYYTDRSLSYDAVKELIASLIQEEIGKYRLSDQVKDLEANWLGENNLTFEEIIETKMNIEEDTNLVNQDFSFYGQVEDNYEVDTTPLLIYTYASFLSAFLIFDFVTRETKSNTRNRFLYLSVSFKMFVFMSFLLITLFTFLFDIIAYLLLLELNTNLLTLLIYRFVINTLVFVTAILSKNVLSLYINALIIFIFLLITQMLLSIINLPSQIAWLEHLHPALELWGGHYNIIPLVISLLILIIYLRRDIFVRS